MAVLWKRVIRSVSLPLTCASDVYKLHGLDRAGHAKWQGFMREGTDVRAYRAHVHLYLLISEDENVLWSFCDYLPPAQSNTNLERSLKSFSGHVIYLWSQVDHDYSHRCRSSVNFRGHDIFCPKNARIFHNNCHASLRGR